MFLISSRELQFNSDTDTCFDNIVLINALPSIFRQIRLLYGRQIVDGRGHALPLRSCSGPAAHRSCTSQVGQY